MERSIDIVWATVIEEYSAKEENELSLSYGDRIQIVSIDQLESGKSGWWLGLKNVTDNDSKMGIFPMNYVHIDFPLNNSYCVDDERIIPRKRFSSLRPTTNYASLSPEVKSLIVDANKLTVEKFVGSGSYGLVFKGTYQGKTVALKAFNTKIEFIQNEVLNLFRVKSRHFVEFFGVANLVEKDNPEELSKFTNFPQFNASIIIEYAHGGTLSELLAQRPVISPKLLLNWARQICEGMLYLHEKAKLFHRDLKTSNILIKESLKEPLNEENLLNKTILISDLGMACNADILIEDQSKLGTIAYAAPEVLKESKFLFQSDVWSFGVILWEMLTTEVPFRGIEQPHLFFLLTLKNFELFIPQSWEEERPENFITADDVGIPKLLKNSLRACWAKNTEERPEFHELLSILDQAEEQHFMLLTPDEFSLIQANWRSQISRHRTKLLENLSTDSSIQNEEVQLIQEISKLKEERKILQDALEKKDAEFKRKEEEFSKIIQQMRQNMFKFAVNTANHMVPGNSQNNLAANSQLNNQTNTNSTFKPFKSTLNSFFKSSKAPTYFATNVGETSDEISAASLNTYPFHTSGALSTNGKLKFQDMSQESFPSIRDDDEDIITLSPTSREGSRKASISLKIGPHDQPSFGSAKNSGNLAISPPSNLLHLVHVGVDKNASAFNDSTCNSTSTMPISRDRFDVNKKSATLERSNNLDNISDIKFPSLSTTIYNIQNNNNNDHSNISQENICDPIFKSTPSLLPLNVQIRPKGAINITSMNIGSNEKFNAAHINLSSKNLAEMWKTSKSSQTNLNGDKTQNSVVIHKNSPGFSTQKKRNFFFSGRSRSNEDCRTNKTKISDQINLLNFKAIPPLHPSKALGAKLPVEVLITAGPPTTTLDRVFAPGIPFNDSKNEKYSSSSVRLPSSSRKKKNNSNYSSIRNGQSRRHNQNSKMDVELKSSVPTSVQTVLWSVFQLAGITSLLLVNENEDTTHENADISQSEDYKNEESQKLCKSTLNDSPTSIDSLKITPTFPDQPYEDLAISDEVINSVSSSRDAYLLAMKDGYLKGVTPPTPCPIASFGDCPIGPISLSTPTLKRDQNIAVSDQIAKEKKYNSCNSFVPSMPGL